MLFSRIVLLTTFAVVVSGSAIPIWELLNHEEKMGRLMYIFMHLVTQYCRSSDIPDCKKVLTLYGMSNLVAESDDVINRLDPYQRNAKTLIWDRVMKGDFKLPKANNNKAHAHYNTVEDNHIDNDYDTLNEIDNTKHHSKYNKISHPNDPHPYAVRVPAPSKFFTTTTTTEEPSTTTTVKTTTEPPVIVQDPYEQYLDARVSDRAESHPYAVRALPLNHEPTSIKHSVDFEPIMTESRQRDVIHPSKKGVSVIHVLPPPANNPWYRRRVQAPSSRFS